MIALIDVDRIERVDEAVGRRDRDYMLGLVESRLRANLRPTDTLLRRNDHEFALVSDAPHHAERICRRLLETVAEPIEGRGRSFWLTASIGATCSRVVDDPTDHIRFAGDALRQAKDRGGDCCVVLEDR